MNAAAEAWFSARGWTPHAFQREVWAAMAATGLVAQASPAKRLSAIGLAAGAAAGVLASAPFHSAVAWAT